MLYSEEPCRELNSGTGLNLNITYNIQPAFFFHPSRLLIIKAGTEYPFNNSLNIHVSRVKIVL